MLIQSATPKKNASADGITGTSRNVLSDFDKVSKYKPDLRLEAKLSAEVSVWIKSALFVFVKYTTTFRTRVLYEFYDLI